MVRLMLTGGKDLPASSRGHGDNVRQTRDDCRTRHRGTGLDLIE